MSRRLLLLDPRGRVVLADVDTGDRLAIGADHPASQGTWARTAVWSPTGPWLAWAAGAGPMDGPDETDLLDDDTQNLLVHHLPTSETRVIAPAVTAFYLSPSPCGRRLSHLSPGPLGLELAVSDVRTGDLRIIERGQPMFWAWSPDGNRLAVHVEDRVVIADVDTGDVDEVTDRAGEFIAPWWAADGGVIYVHEDRVFRRAPDGSNREIVEHSGTGRLALDSSGRRLAFVDVVQGQSCLVALDLATGIRDVVTDERAAAFYWSPDGNRLAALVIASATEVQWLIHDGDGEQRLAPFRPSIEWIRAVVPFFEQYTLSHPVWSPDGRFMVVPARDTDGSTEALIQATAAPWSTEHVPGARLAWWAPTA